jgi:hypothetical protein
LEAFTAILRDWQSFYTTVAQSSVTLAGLLFVSLSLHRDLIMRSENARLLRLARGSFEDFLTVLMLGLVFLVPHQVPMGLAVALFVLGGSRGYEIVRQSIHTRKKRTEIQFND